MSTKQLLTMICITTALALVLAWVIEETQVRRFKDEFSTWWEAQNAGQSKPDDAAANE